MAAGGGTRRTQGNEIGSYCNNPSEDGGDSHQVEASGGGDKVSDRVLVPVNRNYEGVIY